MSLKHRKASWNRLDTAEPLSFIIIIAPQDMYLDKLTQEVQQMEEHNGLLEAQWQAQAQDTKAMKEAVTEATMEMEVSHVTSLIQRTNGTENIVV